MEHKHLAHLDESGLFSKTRSWRAVFLITFVLRIYLAVSDSYIHPDEHFQGPEAIADKVFGWATKTSWEFSSEHPARSYVSVWLAYGLPMAIFQALLGHSHLSSIDPQMMFLTLRLAFASATWSLTDMAIDRLSESKSDRLKGLFFVATSYVTWTYQSHTFSNSVETVILLWCLVIIHEFTSDRATTNSVTRHWDIALLAVLIILGTFNRITFPAFLILPILRLWKLFYKFPLTIFTFITVATATAGLAVYIDTILYDSAEGSQVFFKGYPSILSGLSGYVIAPLNSFLYNTQLSNLDLHGLHPRFTHILINLPQLLGPGIVFLFSTKYLHSLPLQSAFGAIAILSLVPHQEARFLVPTVPLLCWSFDTDVFFTPKQNITKVFLGLWFVFNLFMGIIMGIYHQGGVIPAQEYIGKNLADNAYSVSWWKTYSPPIWLLGRPLGTVDVLDPLSIGETDGERYQSILDYLNNPAQIPETSLSVVDLMGAAPDIVNNILTVIVNSSPPRKRNYFVAPNSSLGNYSTFSELLSTASYKFTEVWSTTKHLSLETLDFSDLSSVYPGLKIWEIEKQ